MERINIEQIIGASKFNRFHFWLTILCFIIILFDGYDLVIYGTVVPILIKEWNLSSVEAGAIGSYGLFGMVFGAILFGILADKYGRKNVIILSLFLFSFFTMLCGFTDHPNMFTIYRFLAGLGLGGIMPNVIALLTDYAPFQLKSLVVSIVLCGYSVGGMLAPIAGMTLMPVFGWKSIFWIAGLPLLLIPFIYKYIPETSDRLVQTGNKREIIRIISKINPEISLSEKAEFVSNHHIKSKVPIADLFKNNLALSTFMFWTTYFMSLLMVYGLNTWLPNLMIKAGYGLNSSLAFLMILQCGSIIGAITIARLSIKYDLKKMLSLLYAIGAVAMILLGFGGNILYIYLLVGIAGASSIGAQHLIQAYVSQYYPPAIRSTALGTASGIGRFGGMFGPMVGGILLSVSLPIQINFLAFAIPGLIASVALAIVPSKRSYGKNEVDYGDHLFLRKVEVE
jgi:MFS transporter, AAHS family, benzoate transport protein